MYAEHGPRLRAFVHRRVDPTTADDVVAEAFLIAWRRLDRMPADPLPWLIGIARGVLANTRRAQIRQFNLHQRIADTAPRSNGSDDVDPTEMARVREALASLSERDQEVLLLVAWDGLDRAQSAQVLAITTAQFAVRLHRARRRLQRMLDQSSPGISPASHSTASEVF